MGGESTLGARWYRSEGRRRGLVGASRSPMGGGEARLKWISRPGLVRGPDRRRLCLMAALGMYGGGGGTVEPHTGLGEQRLRIRPQALSYRVLSASLSRVRSGREIRRVRVPAVNSSDRSPVFVGLDFF